ncbi:hypothetical protein OUZ56_032741 [Daphnia magna]|uniref:Uncharacterized protein n=1 Tax=Daphnia magna TaxID=35525 RepID=A0ABQ9ZX00_9CRUS|nr:hypothetical protein OUZ56_032741 [Daphnia magna]
MSTGGLSVSKLGCHSEEPVFESRITRSENYYIVLNTKVQLSKISINRRVINSVVIRHLNNTQLGYYFALWDFVSLNARPALIGFVSFSSIYDGRLKDSKVSKIHHDYPACYSSHDAVVVGARGAGFCAEFG